MSITEAQPRPRAFWTDVRFVLGLVLIAGSIAAVWVVVAAARQTAPALVSGRTIVAGEQIARDDLAVVDISLGQLETAYLAPGELEPGAVARRTIPQGELVARSAVGDAGGTRTTTVAFAVDGHVPSAVVAGDAVEVWVARRTEPGGFSRPRVLVADASVLSVSRSEAVMGGSATALELVVERGEVAAVLGALADESRLSIVPAVGR